MKLTPTLQSIVPEQSVIDSWPQMRRKKSTHPCQGKCSEFKDEQCGHCLVPQHSSEPILKNHDEAKYYGRALTAERYIP